VGDAVEALPGGMGLDAKHNENNDLWCNAAGGGWGRPVLDRVRRSRWGILEPGGLNG
jgi:hypothetical protein